MSKDKEVHDSMYEGRDEYFMDVDRMMNEGLAGGTVSYKENAGIIEEAHDFLKEDPPLKTE